MKLGDAVSSVATPIARALNMGCIDPVTNDLRADSPCAKRKAIMNQFSDRLVDVFWPAGQQPKGKMRYIVTRQWVIDEAENEEDAVAKSKNIPSVSLSIQARPLQEQQEQKPK